MNSLKKLNKNKPFEIETKKISNSINNLTNCYLGIKKKKKKGGIVIIMNYSYIVV